MNIDETKQLLAVISATYRNFIVSEGTINIWQEIFKDVPCIEVAVAIKAHILQNKFAPVISEINELITASHLPEYLKESAESAIHDRTNPLSKKVWAELENCYGPFGKWNIEDNKWRFKEFIARYEELVEYEIDALKTRNYPQVLAGAKIKELEK